MDLPRRITIAGVGLIGGSLGMAVKGLDNPPEVVGFGTRPANLEHAVELGAIDRWTTDISEACAGSGLLILCTPVRTIAPLIREALDHLPLNAVITDVGSTKAEIVSQVEAMLPDGVHFIGGHPMSGSEVTGVGGATPTLFRRAFYILTPTDRTASHAYGTMHTLASRLGASVLSLPPETHDRMIAMISHMPHMVAAALVNAVAAEQSQGANGNLLALAAGGFRDMTRIAASGADVWIDIAMTNREPIVQAIDKLKVRLDEVKATIQDGDEDGLRELLSDAASLRKNLPGAAEREEGRVRLRVPISDEPGVISNIALIIGEKGINIIDLEMLHLTDEEAVLELFFADLDQAGQAEDALANKGFRAQLLGGI